MVVAVPEVRERVSVPACPSKEIPPAGRGLPLEKSRVRVSLSWEPVMVREVSVERT